MAGFWKRLGRDIGWSILSGLAEDIHNSPDPVEVYPKAERLGKLAYLLVARRRKLLLSNLRTVFPGWPEKRVKATARRIVRNLARGFVDLLGWETAGDKVRSRVSVEHPEHLEEAVSAGKGFFLATGHVGVFPFVGIPVMQAGLTYGTVARDPHDERVAGIFRSARENVGIVSIPDRPPKTVLKGVFDVLGSGGGVLYTFDMHPGGGRGGVTAEFLGAPTPMFGGLVRLAARKRAPILPCYTVREEDGVSHKVVFCKPFHAPPGARDEQSPETAAVMQRLAGWLSEIVRRHPDQWWWIHRRWRSGDQAAAPEARQKS